MLAFSFAPTRTAAALFRGCEPIRAEAILHPAQDAGGPASVEVEREQRVRSVRAFLQASGMAPGALAAVAVHADAGRPMQAGTYRIDAALLREVERQRAGGSEKLAAVVAHAIGEEWRCPAFAIDPVSRDECVGARGGAGERALLAMKAAARRHARAVDRPLETLRLVVVHIATGVSVCIENGARIGDVHHAFESPSADVELEAALARAEAGDGRASSVLHGAANQIAKVVGGLATVLEGDVDAVLVTGSLERAGLILAEICRRVEWIAPVFLYRDQDELLALAQGAHAVLEGAEPLKQYA
ncbi:MAG TPA: hypothetical protein VFK85_09070 [Anaeromyxobacteraceae bacterium]|nr:hypothetical protein [Anaeromyxobacteraceae bacterium]